MDLQEVYDKIEIGELFARYARGVDSRDWELWKAVFRAQSGSLVSSRPSEGRAVATGRYSRRCASRSGRRCG